ncbi:histidine phosphatase family protein [Elioraea sp.]|uniref:histidine phosphatase family protein n=1 Tax=Elioraea sp. TaxID=2185103 RepID=UPI003F6EFABF
MPTRRHSILGAAALVALRPPGGARADEAAWQAAREGRAAVLIRHAIAPGTGDPPGFRLEDCATQRNLSASGRAQARAIGALLRAQGLAGAGLRSSAWCRCIETAELLDLGPVTREPALDSFFADRGAGPARTEALRRLLAAWDAPRPLVLVTHQVNITALTGVFPASGESILVYTGARAGALVLRVPPPAA